MSKTITTVEPIVEAPTETAFGALVAAYVPAERPPSTDDVKAIVWSDTMNTSQKIKALARQGYKNSAIVKLMNPWYMSVKGRELRYQHVRNVLTQNYKKAD
jgi:hypothetical protein